MKIEKINDSDFNIYIFLNNFHEDTIYEDTKLLFQKIQKRLKLKGFYRVIVTYKSVGLFYQVLKVEDAFYKNTLDLKIEIHNDLDVYFKTEDYFKIKNLGTIRYYDGMYYGLVDESFDQIIEKVEFGDFVFGYDNLSFLDKSYVI